MSAAEKRSLHRNPNPYGLEMKAYCDIQGEETEFSVLDFNTLGARLMATTPLGTIKSIGQIRILYGDKVLCDFRNPTVVRQINSQELILSFRGSIGDRTQLRPNRVQMPKILQGVLWGVDPLTVDQLLYFRVLDVSEKGFRILTSKSNSHIFPGMEFESFILQIPGFPQIKVSFRTLNVHEEEGHLSFGCEITKAGKLFAKTFKKLNLMVNDLTPRSAYPVAQVREDIKSVKKFGGHISVRSVRSEKDFSAVMDIRYKAYKSANKTTSNQTVQDMRDEYDTHSLILIAYVGKNPVGTLRMVMKGEGQPTPCEKSFNLQSIAKIKTGSIAEISRFAIDPAFQGTDVFLAVCRKLLLEIAPLSLGFPIQHRCD